MSDKFYDFDKDNSFDEVYSDKIKKRPIKKEYEIEIPMPAKSGLKSTMPKQTEQKSKKGKKGKMTTRKKIAYGIGIPLSCILVFIISMVISFLTFPKIETSQASKIENVEQSTEVIRENDDGSFEMGERQDDGSYNWDLPKGDSVVFSETPDEPAQTPAPNENNKEDENNENGDDEENNEDENGDDEESSSKPSASPSPSPVPVQPDENGIINLD